MRDFQFPGRSPAMATEGMAATSHPLASATAIDVLRRGGNAVDAAVAASAVLAVVEPHMTGLGGDCFAIISTPDGGLHGLNGSGRAARGAEASWFVERGIDKIETESVHAVTAPGSVAAWAHLLEKHGTWDIGRALEPAIRYAEHGFPVTPRVAHDWASDLGKLAANSGAVMHYLKNGAAPVAGDLWRLPALARTLKIVAEKGARAFYEGEIADDIAATIKALGGHLDADDLAATEATDVTPVTSTYRDMEIAEIPPNGQGITALVMLNILKRFDLASLDPHGPERFHLEFEAGRLAYAVRDAFISDPAHMRAPVDVLISDGYGAGLADRISRESRLADVTPEKIPEADTVYLTVVDRDQRAISFINSIYSHFGSGIVTEKTGLVLQNRGACFVVDPKHPNCIGPRKRPMHTIIPGFALRKGRPVMPFGVMGGAYQAVGHAHLITNIVDYGMDPQEALDFPRLFWAADRTTAAAERSIPAATVEGLKARGHQVVTEKNAIGGGQAIFIDRERGVLIGGSDPRKDGCAIGY